MFGAQKKSDGFERHKDRDVPSTKKLRREERRRQAESARQVTVEPPKGVHRPGTATATPARTEEQKSSAIAASHKLRPFIDVAARVVLAWGRQVANALRPAAGPLGRPGMQLVLVLIGAAAAISTVARLTASGFDRDGCLAALVAVVALFLAALPLLLGTQSLNPPDIVRRINEGIARRLPWRGGVRLPWRGGVTVATGRAVTISVLLAAATGGAWLLWEHGRQVASLASLPGFSGQIIEGRAAVVTGDIVRVGGTPVRLGGIEAPERDQRCSPPVNRRQRCSEAATEALARNVRGASVRCEIRGSDNAGRPLATCYAHGTDIAARLVREGHVFASGGFFASYGSLEREARAHKAGLWRGEAERPSEFRARVWEAAKRNAPDGCPIKGSISSGSKTYLLPWSPDYPRIPVRPARGERWFCSEQEAQAAGWKAADAG
jgi:endonuclease YncB( thermonuclease family)